MENRISLLRQAKDGRTYLVAVLHTDEGSFVIPSQTKLEIEAVPGLTQVDVTLRLFDPEIN